MSFGPFTTSNYLSCASTPVSAIPLTLACWCNSTDATANQRLIAIIDTTDGRDYFMIDLSGATAGDPIRAITASAGTTAIASTSTGYSINTWHSVAGVFASATDRRAFIDGGSKGTNITSLTPAGLDQLRLGVNLNTSEAPVSPLIGRLAEAAIWNVALTDDEVASHAKGVSPLKIRPQSLVFYSPLIRDLFDYRAGLTITMNGAVAVADHPRVYGL